MHEIGLRKESPGNEGDPGNVDSTHGLRRSSGERSRYPLQCFCLENSMGRGVWQATVHGFTESDTTEWLSMPAHTTCQCRRWKRLGFDSWAWKIPWGGKWQLTPVFLPGKSYGQRSLVGYSQSMRFERVRQYRTHTHTHTHTEYTWNKVFLNRNLHFKICVKNVLTGGLTGTNPVCSLGAKVQYSLIKDHGNFAEHHHT